MATDATSLLENPKHPVNRTLSLIKLLVLAVSVAAAVPTARNLYFSWKNGVPFNQVDHRLAQADLFEKNFDCKISYRSLAVAGGEKIDVGSCDKTRDISIRISGNGQTNYEWIAFDRLPKPKSKMTGFVDLVVSRAFADERARGQESFEVAQDASVLCQAKSGDNIIRVVQSGGQCTRETVSIFRGSVEKSETVPCNSACPIR
jgi:hypothetical protein